MGDAPRKERVPRGCRVIHMRIERVTGKFGEMGHIFTGDRSGLAMERLTDFNLMEGACERMVVMAPLLRARHPFVGDRGQNVGASLNGCALHVMHHTAYAAHLFTATRPARTAMNQVRQG